MSRKATINRQELIDAAFKITKKKGFEEVTARKLAGAAGCSTQPIFRIYDSMDELKSDVYLKTVDFYDDFYAKAESVSNVPFVNMGIVIINFAKKYPQLFRLLFLADRMPYTKSLYDLINGDKEYVVKEIGKAADRGVQNSEALFMKMWTFIFGCGCMAFTGDFDLAQDDTVTMLASVYETFEQEMN